MDFFPQKPVRMDQQPRLMSSMPALSAGGYDRHRNTRAHPPNKTYSLPNRTAVREEDDTGG